MTRKLVAVVLGIGMIAGLSWIATGEVSPFVVPFEPVKTYRAFSQTAGAASLFFREPDGSYARLSFGISSPYKLLTSVVALGSLLSNPGAFLSSPAGPANVGRAGQLGAGGVFTSSGGLGGAYAFPGSRRLTVYLGTASLLYTGATSYDLGFPISSILAEDLNGDKASDLLIGLIDVFNNGTKVAGGLGVMLNRGDGSFAPMVKYTAGSAGYAIAAADINKDGRTDVVVTDSDNGALEVLAGNGDGTFQSAVEYPAPGIFSVTIADVTGDGNLDLAGAGSGMLVLPGNGDGTFRTSVPIAPPSNVSMTAIVAGDFTGDNRLDLAVASLRQSTVAIYRNTGSGQFEPGESYAVGYGPDSLLVADIDKDGKLDLVTGIGDARWFGPAFNSFSNEILYGRGDGTFEGARVSAIPGQARFLAAADFDGDGFSDAVVNNGSDDLAFFAGEAGGRIAAKPRVIALTYGSYPVDALAGDFDGDGRQDLAIAENNSDKVAVLLGSSSGLRAPMESNAGGTQPAGIAAADFDGDGHLDLAVTNQIEGMTAILKGSGNGAFQTLGAYSTGTTPGPISAADFTGDGRADLAVADTVQDAKVYLLRNNGSGSFLPLTPISIGTKANSILLKDVNKDGKSDIVAAADGPNFTWLVGIALGNGDGTFQTPQLLNADFGPTNVVVEDFDGDGNQDMYVTHCCGETYGGYFRGTGPGTFAPEKLMDVPVSPSFARAVRLNATDPSALPDLIVTTNQTGVVAMPNTQKVFRNRNSASYVPGELAPDMIVTGEAPGIAPQLIVAQQTPWPAELGGAHVDVIDSTGASRQAPIYYVSPTAVSYLMPASVTVGWVTVKVHTSSGVDMQEQVYVNPVAPGIYSANASGSGAAAAFYLRVAADGSRTQDLVFDSNLNPAPLDLSPVGDQVYLLLYGTGFRNGTTVTAQVGGKATPVLGVAAHSIYQGLDQVNLGPLPRTLIGAGVVNVTLTIDGRPTNPVTVRIK